MNKLEDGMFIRTDDGKINKFKRYITDKKRVCETDMYARLAVDNIVKASFNIIDLIEAGDYVNGYKVSFKGNDYQPFVQCDYPVQKGTTNHYRFYEKAIYSIVTKEQFEAMEYKVESEVK